jgi:hypothetical protein
MDGSRLPLEGNLFPTEPQLEMDRCASTSIEGVATTIVATILTTLGETSSTTETLVVS